MNAAVRTAGLVTTVLFVACTGVYYGPTSVPDPEPPKPVVVAVEITRNGVSPLTTGGSRAFVRFVNRDIEVHDVRSDPHSDHGGCTELNVGIIRPGHEVTVLTPLESGRTCGFHDDTRLDDARFQGVVTIQ